MNLLLTLYSIVYKYIYLVLELFQSPALHTITHVHANRLCLESAHKL